MKVTEIFAVAKRTIEAGEYILLKVDENRVESDELILTEEGARHFLKGCKHDHETLV